MTFYYTLSRTGTKLLFCLIWVAFSISSNGELAVGVVQGNVFMSWRINNTDINSSRAVFSPGGATVIFFMPGQVIGNAGASHNTRVRDIGNVSHGIVSFRLLNLTVADAGRYYYRPVLGSDAGGQVLAIAGVPANVSVMEVSDPFENNEYTMTCSAQTTSVPIGMELTMHYQWKRDKDQNITAGDRYSFSYDRSNLTINPLKRQDAAYSFVCQAWEHVDAVSQSDPFTLKVFYGPDPGSIRLSPNRTFHEIVESLPLSVNCSTECFPDCQYRWTGPGGSNLGSTGLFYVLSIARSQTGLYTCTASNSKISNNTVTATISVAVSYGPDIPLTLDPVTTSYREKEGTFIPNITCSADCKPQCNYQWTGPLVATSSGVLSIGTIDRLKRGTYFCTARNPRTFSAVNGSAIHIVVIYGPDTPNLSPNTTVYTKLEGESVPDINCSADCFPGCTQVWMKGLTPVQDNDGTTLELRQVYRDKAGDYTCCFNNTESKAVGYVSIKLVVQYPPVLTMKATNTSKGGRVVIKCTASGVPNNYTFFKWTHRAPDKSGTIVRELEITRVSGSEVSFTIDGATYQDTGFYVCKASNGITHYSTGKFIMEDMASVWIADQALITSNIKDFDAEKGKSGQMHIEFYSGLLQPIVTWYIVKNGTMELLQNSSGFVIVLSTITVGLQYQQRTVELPGYNASLEVSNVNEIYFTSYKVEINNSFIEKTLVTLELKARGPPETPANLSVVLDSVTTHSLQLTWQAGFHGGASQTFVIEYRADGVINWLNKTEPGGLVLYVTLNSTITDLKDGTKYEFRIYSENVFNRSQVSSTIDETTKTVMKGKRDIPDGSSVITGASTGSALALVTAVAIAGFLIWKRSQTIKAPVEGLVDNPVYDISGPLHDPSTNGGATGVEYSAVLKPKKTGGQVQDPSTLYAQIDKTSMEKKKGQKKEKHGRTLRGDIYENATIVGRDNFKGNTYANSGDLKTNENVYENPGVEAPKGSLANKDGLMYAELMLDPPTTKNGKYVIRSLENCTEYAEICYGKRGEPLPDNNEEK